MEGLYDGLAGEWLWKGSLYKFEFLKREVEGTDTRCGGVGSNLNVLVITY